ncbi:MAG: HupE/UreJ family protein [Saprospiraceae bacterium]|uniref:HupE/UreJ family protein n=1 Tax=Candidatus Opimibacter skivensis TaxID=2982028 RepID=A0A9D7SSX7_9BACT|nr:HupE/UreJ family protein [Candidatus Opimibacter skivensis]
MFQVYLRLGIDHILNISAFDHIVFIIALCAMYAATDWKRILILVTAFTLGHSITLAMSSLNIISLKPELVELLIPITILITAIQNLIVKPKPDQRWRPNYFLALFFGFIHGMGFSNYFKALLGREASIVLPLFGFNLGVEIGQLCIVACIMILNYMVVSVGKVKQSKWNLIVSTLAAILAVYMIVQRIRLL